MFFAGLALLMLTFAALYLSGALFDAGGKRQIDTFVLQPNNLSVGRISRPIPVDQLSEKFLRERLIKKFVFEYFYVTPDPENLAQRMRGNSVLAIMSLPAVFQEWASTQSEVIEDLARNRALRTVSVADEIIKKGDYWEVYYQLKTWTEPNNMDTVPVIYDGIMYIKVSFEKGIRNQIRGKDLDVQEYLGQGKDPAAIFKFQVEEVRR
jgi:hypothetical protein